MRAVIQEFDEKVLEIERYFSFLECALDGRSKIIRDQKNSKRGTFFNAELQKILKANSFLLLYNLIESTIRRAVAEIFEAVRQERLSYVDVSDELQRLWVRQRFINIDHGPHRPDTIRSKAHSLVEDAVARVIVDLTEEDLPISGNLDARKIREIADMVGFSSKAHWRSRGGQKLQLVKNMRNSLAHGDLSFGECGRDFARQELEEIKKEVIVYLRSIIRNIDKFISEYGHKK